MNNAAYWAPVEELFGPRLRAPHRATLEYRQPLDLGDPLELRVAGDGLWFLGRRSRARCGHTGRLMRAGALRLYLIGALVLAAVLSVVGKKTNSPWIGWVSFVVVPGRSRSLLHLAARRLAGAAW